MTDPYAVLGLPKTASADDVRKAFRGLAKKHHPDLNPGDAGAEARFKEISLANDLLSDPDKRRRFDAGEIDAAGQEMPPRGYYRDHAGSNGGRKYDRAGAEEHFVDMGGVFADLFGERRGFGDRGPDMAGMPLSFSLAVPFLLAARGGKQRVTLPDGRDLDIAVPEGTSDRQTIRLKGQGMPGAGGAPAGDAYVEIHVQPHAFFEPRDHDIHVELPVTPAEAVLGGKVATPTIGGIVMLNIPAGSNTGTSLRLKGRGLLDRKSRTRGDQYVKLKVVLPDKPDAALEEFLRTWEAGRA